MPLLRAYLQRKRAAIVKPYLRGDVLDVGCGSSYIMRFLDANQLYYGIDSNEGLINRLKVKYPQYGFLVKDVESGQINLRDKFDTIVLIALIEHLKTPECILAICRDLLKNGGNLVVTTPNPLGAKLHKLGAYLGLTSKSAVGGHHKIYNHGEMDKLLKSVGFEICIYRKFEFGMNQLFVSHRV